MKTEHSAGFVIFRLERGVREYLLLYKKADGIYRENWSFPKGWPDKGESDLDAAKRETAEEAGITQIKQIAGFKATSKYSFQDSKGELISKTVTWFLGETKQKAVKVSWEHAGFEWLAYAEAMEQLTYRSDKTVLEKAEKYLK
jgi:bis(5'-nucleosidyl)-tetraphosphatase